MRDRTPVVLVHGIRMNGAIWAALAARLEPRRRVVAPDLPGHGDSADEVFTLDGAAAVVLRAVEEAGAPALVLGHSLGGAVAARAARTRPAAVAGLVGVGCTFPRGGGLVRPAYRAMTWVAGRAPGTGDRLTELALRRLLPAPVRDPMLARGLATSSVPQIMAAVADVDVAAELAGYAGPVWLVNGTFDQFRIGERACHAACPDGRLIVWPGANHVTELADVERLATLVEDACAVIESP